MLWDVVLVGCLLSFSVEASAVWIFLLLYLTWQFYFFLTPELFFLISRYVFYCYKMFFEHQLLLCTNKLSSFLTVSILLHTKLYKLTSLLSCNSFLFFFLEKCVMWVEYIPLRWRDGKWLKVLCLVKSYSTYIRLSKWTILCLTLCSFVYYL